MWRIIKFKNLFRGLWGSLFTCVCEIFKVVTHTVLLDVSITYMIFGNLSRSVILLKFCWKSSSNLWELWGVQAKICTSIFAKILSKIFATCASYHSVIFFLDLPKVFSRTLKYSILMIFFDLCPVFEDL